MIARTRCYFVFWTGILALLVALGSLAASAADQQRLALVIGNADYPDADSPLLVALKNARAVAAQLQKAGFEADTFEDLTKEALQQTLQRFYEKIESGAIVVFFFSGYGIQTARQNFIIPIDAQIWTEADVRRTGVSIDAILAAIRQRGAGTRILVLDASRRNPFERRFRSYSAGLAAMDTPANTIVIAAAMPGKVISDADPEGSLFVDELLRQTNAPGVPVVDVFNHTREDVSRATNGEQVPWVSVNLTNKLYIRPPTPLLPRRPERAKQKLPVQ